MATSAARGHGVGDGTVTAELPPGAVGPVDTAEEAAEGPAATEASPESDANGPQATGDLEGTDRAAATATVRSYVAALDDRDAGRVCALFAPGALPLGDLPRRRGGCRASLRASIGSRPADGGPAWRRTEIFEVKPEAIGADRARLTTTVTHHFSDRKYVSVEDDVIYLERVGGRWLLAKPSATFYRAVGYRATSAAGVLTARRLVAQKRWLPPPRGARSCRRLGCLRLDTGDRRVATRLHRDAGSSRRRPNWSAHRSRARRRRVSG